jgi:outer membrane protein assembly factor BamB
VSATARGGVAPPWSQFRGPGGAGVASEGTELPVTWSATENVVWAAAIPGKGWSSPIVWGDRVFLTTVIGPGDAEPPPAPETLTFRDHVEGVTTQAPHRWVVLCLDRQSGRIVWQQTAHAGVPSWPIHPKNGYASETPVTDGERVYAQFGNVGLFCYDLDGNKVWAREWTPVRMGWNWGPAASPVLHGERIYVVNDNEEKSYLLALDKRTGRDVWRVDRDEKSNWANPFVWAHDARTELVTAGSGAVRSYGLDGMLLWQLSGMSSVTVPTPVATHGLLFVSSGCNHSRQRPVYAIRPGAQGDISLGAGQTSNEFIAWCQPLAAPYVPSPVVQGDCLCVLNDQGTLGCYDARSGKEVYARQRVGKGPFSASPWADARHVYCLNEAGDTFVMAAGPEFRAVGCNRLGETCLATPAISGNSLLLRTLTRLYRIETHAPP